jgi:hypothetical protein
MGHLGRAVVVSVIGLLAVHSAGAAPLNWEGTSTSKVGDLPALRFVGGGVATVNSSGGTIPAHLATLRLKGSRGGLTGTATTLVTDPETAGNSIVRVIVQAAGGTGTLGPISGGAASTTVLTRGRLPVKGMAKICLLSTVCTNFVPLLLTEPTAGGVGVQGVGVGGQLVAGGAGAVRISLEAAPWTIKTATVTDQTDVNTGSLAFVPVTAMGFAHGPASATSSTAQPNGVVQLVTPSQVRTNLALGTNVKVGVLTSLLVRFIPEPGLLLLLGSGVAGLVLLGRNRIRR